jgi:hypothetical protein
VPHAVSDVWQSFIQIVTENRIRDFSAKSIDIGLKVQPPRTGCVEVLLPIAIEDADRQASSER